MGGRPPAGYIAPACRVMSSSTHRVNWWPPQCVKSRTPEEWSFQPIPSSEYSWPCTVRVPVVRMHLQQGMRILLAVHGQGAGGPHALLQVRVPGELVGLGLGGLVVEVPDRGGRGGGDLPAH